MTTSPQSVIDLDGIKGRAALLAKALGSPVAQQVGGTDVPALVARVEQLEKALEVAAKAELYDPTTGIVDADALEAVQQVARAALSDRTSP